MGLGFRKPHAAVSIKWEEVSPTSQARSQPKSGQSRPAACCLVPLNSTPMVVDPDVADSSPRYSRRVKGGWGPIAVAVLLAVRKAQANFRDVFTPEVEVNVPTPKHRDQRWITEAWGGDTEPEYSPPYGIVHNGRHRVLGVKAAGGRVAPEIDSALGDAVRGSHADGRYWFVPDKETVEDWVAQRKWWDVADQASD